ncbi:MAG TPA: hypothetical protein VI136_26225 [Verrucomicrobiae bacterium]
MKTQVSHCTAVTGGYALLMVLGLTAISAIVLAASMSRTRTVAELNERNNEYTANLNVAEAAVEKAFARMAYDFQSYGYGAVKNNLDLYRTNIPNSTESPYWSDYEFSDAQGNANRTYVGFLTNFNGMLPSQYPGAFAIDSPVYRIVSNVRSKDGRHAITNAVQVDVLFAFVPITTYAIFYNSLLEFSTCATMTVNGRTHANGNIYTGTSASLTFNGTVTTTGTISSPRWNGQGPSWANKGNYYGNPTYKTNVPTVSISINMTNTRSLIEIPPPSESPSSHAGQQRLYNQAHVVLLVSNSTVTAKIRNSVNGQIPGVDPAPVTIQSSTNYSALATNFPFLSLTNNFTDQREGKTILPSQIDIGKYAKWLTTNGTVLGKFPSGSGTYPTILFVADNRTTTSSQLTGVRVTNGIAPPKNGGLGFSLATPNPLYVLGHYNCTNSAHLGTTNTTSTVPCAFMSDALTVLSSSWDDTKSANSYTTRVPVNTTVNAAILTGNTLSTGPESTQFNGGVHNLPRLLEDWNSPSAKTLTLNTSLINLYTSARATTQFKNPGQYYDPPTRQFSFDLNFMDPAKQPPGVPSALVPIRFNWAVPPPGCVTYNVTP